MKQCPSCGARFWWTGEPREFYFCSDRCESKFAEQRAIAMTETASAAKGEAEVADHVAEVIKSCGPIGEYKLTPVVYLMSEASELVGKCVSKPHEADAWALFGVFDDQTIELWDFDTAAEAAAVLAAALAKAAS